MPSIALRVDRIDYLTNRGFPVQAWRPYARIRLPLVGGGSTDLSCIVDTGAPWSVIPYSIWHAYNVEWSFFGRQVFRQSTPDPRALTWQGVDCDLGVTEVEILDQQTGTGMGPFLVLAKFPHGNPRILRGAAQPEAILGLDFLLANRLRLTLDGTSGLLTAEYFVP